jgi:hypothetical protein
LSLGIPMYIASMLGKFRWNCPLAANQTQIDHTPGFILFDKVCPSGCRSKLWSTKWPFRFTRPFWSQWRGGLQPASVFSRWIERITHLKRVQIDTKRASADV